MEARINFQLAVRQQLVLQDGRIFIGDHLVVISLHHQHRKVIDRSSRLVGLSENAHAFIMGFGAADHPLSPPVLDRPWEGYLCSITIEAS